MTTSNSISRTPTLTNASELLPIIVPSMPESPEAERYLREQMAKFLFSEVLRYSRVQYCPFQALGLPEMKLWNEHLISQGAPSYDGLLAVLSQVLRSIYRGVPVSNQEIMVLRRLLQLPEA